MRKIIFFMFLAFFVVTNVVSATSTRVYVDPSSIVDSSLGVGDQFTVDIKIDDVLDLYGFVYKLEYNPNILNGKSITSSFLDGEPMILKNETDNEIGKIEFVITSLNPAVPKTGSGTLATINFQVNGVGDSILNLYDTQIADRSAKSIEHTAEDGYFNNIPPITTTTIYRPPSRPRPRGFLSTISSFFSGLFGF
jgi:hypothetical protein